MMTSIIAVAFLNLAIQDEGPVSFRSLLANGRWDELKRRIEQDRAKVKHHRPKTQAMIYLDAVYFTRDGTRYGRAMTAVRMYHEAGYDVTADGNAALRSAIATDHKGDMVRRLISYGARAKGLQGGGPIRYEHADLLEYVISQGAEVQSEINYPTSNDGRSYAMRTPLQFAAWKGYGDCLKVLIRARVNLNAKNSVTGRTALHEAVEGNPFRGGQEDMIKLLLRAGANPEIKDKKGRTPKQMAVAIKRPDLAKLFAGRRP